MSMLLDNSAELILKRELGPNERLLWSGIPRQGLLFRASDLFVIPFSLMWAGFACFWEYSVTTTKKAPHFFMLWGIPFVLMGFYIVIGRFFVDSYLRSRTYYGVTDHRALILSGLITRDVKSLSIKNLDEISLKERDDGSGDILFGSTTSTYPTGFTLGRSNAIRNVVPTFELIENARKVYDLIKNAQQS